MPNFDGTGPLKRGRIIGRGLGPCKNGAGVCLRRAQDGGSPQKEEACDGSSE